MKPESTFDYTVVEENIDEDYSWYQENAALLRHIQRFATSLTEGGGHGQLILRFADGKFIGSDSEIRERHPLDLTAYRG